MASNNTDNFLNPALASVAPHDRVFSWHAQASLWFSMGVGLLVMQVGAYLVPGASTQDAALAIVLGSLLGAALLAWTARVACNTGLTSAGLMHHTYGSYFARLPILLNITQLMGWTTFELVIMRDGTSAIAQQSLGLDAHNPLLLAGATVLWGVVLALLLSGSMTRLVRQVIGRFGLPLVIASLLWLSWQFGTQLQHVGLDAFWAKKGDASMGLLSAMDLVIGMPVSWLPLVADYARHGRSGRGAMGGTFLGYAIANIWCFALGVVVVTVGPPNLDLVSVLLLAQGGLLALSLILVDEIDNAYGDTYSAAVCAHSLKPQWTIRRWGVGLAVACTLLALVLPIHSIEPFLLLLSSVFVPLFGVILGRMGSGMASALSTEKRIDWMAAALWLIGFALFRAIALWAPQWGATLPTLGVTLALAWLTRPKN